MHLEYTKWLVMKITSYFYILEKNTRKFSHEMNFWMQHSNYNNKFNTIKSYEI